MVADDELSHSGRVGGLVRTAVSVAGAVCLQVVVASRSSIGRRCVTIFERRAIVVSLSSLFD